MSQRKSGTCSAPGSWLHPSMPCSPGGEFLWPCSGHSTQGGAILGPTMMTLVPIFVAGMVLLIRVLLINTFSIAGEDLFSVADDSILTI